MLNVTYPLIPQEWERFCSGKRAVLVIEEGQPEYIEQAANQILRQRNISARLLGKQVLPMHGEYTVDVLRQGLRQFLDECSPSLPTAAAPSATEVPLVPMQVRRASCRHGPRACVSAARNGRSSRR